MLPSTLFPAGWKELGGGGLVLQSWRSCGCRPHTFSTESESLPRPKQCAVSLCRDDTGPASSTKPVPCGGLACSGATRGGGSDRTDSLPQVAHAPSASADALWEGSGKTATKALSGKSSMWSTYCQYPGMETREGNKGKRKDEWVWWRVGRWTESQGRLWGLCGARQNIYQTTREI